jgi:cytochrome d ubiquinol oxidase subunit I
MASSSISLPQIMTSLLSFIVFYTVLAIIEIYLMVKYVRIGPDAIEGASHAH